MAYIYKLDTCECGSPKSVRAKKCDNCKELSMADSETKNCSGCNLNLPVEKFRLRVRSNRSSYLEGKCKDCEREREKVRLKTTDTGKEKKKRSYIATRKWQLKNPEKRAITTFRSRCKKLGLLHMVEELAVIVKTQITCQICGIGEVPLCIDHDHDTGKFRGILCHGCNIGLGGFKDNIESLNKCIQYLENSRIDTLETSIEQNADQDDSTTDSILTNVEKRQA